MGSKRVEVIDMEEFLKRRDKLVQVSQPLLFRVIDSSDISAGKDTEGRTLLRACRQHRGYVVLEGQRVWGLYGDDSEKYDISAVIYQSIEKRKKD